MAVHKWAEILKGNALLVLAVLLCVGLFAVFFPSFYSSIDEHEYLKNASLLVQGKVTDVSPLDYCGGRMTAQNYRSTYYLGKSFFLVPFLPFGLEAAMLSGLLIHLLNAVILFFIFHRLKIDTRFVILYLFFPAFVWNSRTLNTELLTLTMAFAGTFFFLEKKKWSGFLSGLFFGLATLIRYDQALLFIGFAVAAILSDRRRSAGIFAGFLAIALLIVGINSAFYGGPLNAPQGSDAIHFLTGQNPYQYSYFGGKIVLSSLSANLLVWIAIFLIAYPLMLLAPLYILFSRQKVPSGKKSWQFFSWLKHILSDDPKKTALAIGLSAIPLFYLFSQYTGQASYEFLSPLTITARMRYLIPLAGLLLIPYAASLQALLPEILPKIRLNLRVFFVLAFLVLGSGAVLVSFEHQQQLIVPRETVLNQVLDHTPDNALVIGSSDDCLYFNPLFSGNRQYYKVDSNFFSLDNLIESSSRPVFFMELRYSNRSESADRQGIISSERKAILDAIRDYNAQLTMVFSVQEPHSLALYSFEKKVE